MKLASYNEEVVKAIPSSVNKVNNTNIPTQDMDIIDSLVKEHDIRFPDLVGR